MLSRFQLRVQLGAVDGKDAIKSVRQGFGILDGRGMYLSDRHLTASVELLANGGWFELCLPPTDIAVSRHNLTA